MDVASLAAIAVAAQRGKTAAAIRAELAKLAHAQDQAVVALFADAAEAGKEPKTHVAGSAGLVDLTV